MRASKKSSIIGFGLLFGLSAFTINSIAKEPQLGLGSERPTFGKAVPEMVIPAGPHFLTTGAGNSRVPVFMPASFFFDGSAPTAQMVELEGAAIAPKPARADGFYWEFARLAAPENGEVDAAFGQAIDVDMEWRRRAPYDTIMVQYQDAVLPRIGTQATVEMKLADVRMRSLEPIEVTGTETKYYDLTVEIKPYHQGSGRTEQMGSMTLTRDGASTGYFTSEVFGWARFIFTPLDGSETLVYDHDEYLTIGTTVPTPFFIPALQSPGEVSAAATQISYCCNMESMCLIDDLCGGLCCAVHCP